MYFNRVEIGGVKTVKCLRVDLEVIKHGGPGVRGDINLGSRIFKILEDA